jgi:hypothetical protein
MALGSAPFDAFFRRQSQFTPEGPSIRSISVGARWMRMVHFVCDVLRAATRRSYDVFDISHHRSFRFRRPLRFRLHR